MGQEVHLGLPGPWAEDYREKADHCTTKIGGIPVYAPVAKLNIENRTIYVLVCPKPKCGSNPQSWKVLKVQKCQSSAQTNGKVDETDQIKENVCSSEASSSFLNESHEGSDDDFDLDALANALEQAATLASNSKKQNESKRILPCFYIYYDKEQFGGKSIQGSNSSASTLVKEIANIANDKEEKWEGENYEYDRAIGADRTFLKFKKRLDAYPQQCFRYSYGGKPLLASTNRQDSGTCQLCGSPCHYELQLMSPLAYFLHEAGGGSSDYAPDGWTWLTLVIYTCSKGCCPSSCVGKSGSCCWGVAEEEIMIQED